MKLGTSTPLSFAIALLAALLTFGANPGHAQATDANYVLRAQDTVDVRVFQEDNLNRRATIGQDGTVSLVLLERPLRIAGLTTQQAEAAIRAAYANGYLVKPQVTVSVAQYASRRVMVLGQVGKQGPVTFRPGEPMTILQAIADAGGFTRLANAKSVIVKRTNGQTITVNVKEMASNTGTTPFYLQEGDVITVKESLF